MAQRGSAAAREAWRLLAELFLSDENHDRFHGACVAADLSPPQLKALLSMEPGVGQSMRSLAERWRCDASWVTGIVDGLEERGYAERQPHATDRRVKVVVITQLGEKAKQRAMDVLTRPPRFVTHALTRDEQAQLVGLLAKIAAAAKS